jgi:glycosyltransferase involved in cell wall biosynthesis
LDLPASSRIPGRVALVVGTTAGGTGTHVRMLAAGLSDRGIGVSVLGPSSADAAFRFGAIDEVTFSPVEFGDRPSAPDVAAVLRLRRLLSSLRGEAGQGGPAGLAGQACLAGQAGLAAPPGVVHAHGLRAGALTVIAVAGVSGRGRPGRPRLGRRPGLVVTVHNAPPPGRGAPALIYRALERLVARRADLVVCVSADLEARMRSAGASRTGRAIVPPPDPETRPKAGQAPDDDAPASASIPAGLGGTVLAGRPLVLAVGRLAAQKGFDVLLGAAARWVDLDPVPLLAIAGDGPLAGELRAQAASLDVDAVFLGHRDDIADLLAAAAVFVLPSRWEGQPLILQEALRAGVAIVATRAGGIPDLTDDNAALLVAPGDAPGLAAAVRAVLTDVALASRLRVSASRRGAALPTTDDAIAAALAAYAQVQESTRPATGHRTPT